MRSFGSVAEKLRSYTGTSVHICKSIGRLTAFALPYGGMIGCQTESLVLY